MDTPETQKPAEKTKAAGKPTTAFSVLAAGFDPPTSEALRVKLGVKRSNQHEPVADADFAKAVKEITPPPDETEKA